MPYNLDATVTISDIKDRTLRYVASLRLKHNNRFNGYKYAYNSTRPVLYATIAALLIKHLYNALDENCEEELVYLQKFQCADGLFRDPVIACAQAEYEDWWGWRHLTLHALMVLALYETPADRFIQYTDELGGEVTFRNYLESMDWGLRVNYTSNAIQNIGVMLQYARDYQHNDKAASLMDVLYDVIDSHQDIHSGLYGSSFNTPTEISRGVQAGYHFWLLYSYDRRPVHYVRRIIDSVLTTQNALGGYSVKWNSSACEDVDSIDPLCRFACQAYRQNDIQSSLRLALAAVLHNLNGDGGWVFRRHESMTYGFSPHMFSSVNESNIFFSWFRTLGLAYCLSGIDDLPQEWQMNWQWKHCPGLQFL